ncbi:hypothetical protein PGT21_023301 [Puccinia graminis f. sp. tritici]|uniref:Aspartate/ornithine carbamoyltransferase carbamoyl-P binding domain-containing protein n=1 Tax=Puccinia graminis f. sp. tritici TaxID=56615 RepID=A0A5B0RE90_PUCGR|nr:hypothetical protein PGT21_023301 [Puccinia graminis f. sp. tritici]KAA1124037.1 hypothetical protein PGTUg99_022633 [Puccinia graminis f. sp. tritici]
MCRLGGRVVSISADQSSTAKGESLPNTIRTLGCYCDEIILQHPVAGSSRSAANVSPFINAGDGVGEHPTQAFLDVYTLPEELGTVNGLTITMVGDLENGRTVHSLLKFLCLYQVNLIFVLPRLLALPPDERVFIPARREKPLPASWCTYQLAGRDSSRQAGMNTLLSGGFSPDERVCTPARWEESLPVSWYTIQLTGRDSSQQAGL